MGTPHVRHEIAAIFTNRRLQTISPGLQGYTPAYVALKLHRARKNVNCDTK
jgi:hypothetical protein